MVQADDATSTLTDENEYTVRRQTKKEGKDDCEVENIIKSYAVTHEDNIALISYLAHHFVSSNVVERKHFSSFADSNGPFGKPTSKKRTVLRKTLSIWKKKRGILPTDSFVFRKIRSDPGLR